MSDEIFGLRKDVAAVREAALLVGEEGRKTLCEVEDGAAADE